MMWSSTRACTGILCAHHYLGPISRGVAWQDEFGVIVISAPTSRRLPISWIELSRWCIVSKEKNAGSQQWARFARSLRLANKAATTVISYSDPSQGHTGALYRACNWWWAPTWHRLRPPPTGNGKWSNTDAESVKDRWVFPLRADADRTGILTLQDDAVLKRYPWAVYSEPGGVSYKAWIRERAEIERAEIAA